MKEGAWKIIAIVFIILFFALAFMVVWGILLLDEEEEETNNCYYNTCSENPQALYEDGVCTCYDLDLMGNYIIVKQEYKK